MSGYVEAPYGLSARQVYSPAARVLHWLTALGVAILIPVAWTMNNIGDGPLKDALYEVHKSTGMVLFVLVLLRIAVRLSGGAPPPDPTLPAFNRIASAIVHGLIYLILLAMPILGYLGTNMCCKPVNLFWVIPIPINVEGSEGTVKAIFAAHEFLGWSLLVLVVLHVSAVVFHQVVRKDGVLYRMVPRD